jgi:GTP-binding protein
MGDRLTNKLVPFDDAPPQLSPTRFVTSGAKVEQLPEHDFPEFAVIGRSNVGKSSLLNALMKRDLVRTSRTPGRTQLLNMFLFEGRIALVDLPGYGYAQMSKAQRSQMQTMIADYLAQRSGLYGVLQLFDARRETPSEEDQQVADWVLQHNRQLLVVLTKIDLVPKNILRNRANAIQKALGIPPGAALLFSSKTNAGRDELVARLRELR